MLIELQTNLPEDWKKKSITSINRASAFARALISSFSLKLHSSSSTWNKVVIDFWMFCLMAKCTKLNTFNEQFIICEGNKQW